MTDSIADMIKERDKIIRTISEKKRAELHQKWKDFYYEMHGSESEARMFDETAAKYANEELNHYINQHKLNPSQHNINKQ